MEAQQQPDQQAGAAPLAFDPSMLAQMQAGQEMDPAAIAQAAEQMNAIQAAFAQQMGAMQQQGGLNLDQNQAVAALGHLQGNQTGADFLNHLQAFQPGAYSAENAAAMVTQGMNGGEDANTESSPPPEEKRLTSDFRGVCWNKKNKRWQAAINSGGKYIYLGSFMDENEAAKSFDEAAIILRANKAKLNFGIEHYQDENGAIKKDANYRKTEAHLQDVMSGQKGNKSKGKRASRASVEEEEFTQGYDSRGASGQQAALYGGYGVPNMQQAGMDDVMAAFANSANANTKSQHYPYNISKRPQAYGVMDPPEGCSAKEVINGDDEAFCMLYTDAEGLTGAMVWDGVGCVDMGAFDTENDARRAGAAHLKFAMYARQCNMTSMMMSMSGLGGLAGMDPNAQANFNLGLPGLGADGAGGGAGQDAASLAVAAAAAAAGGGGGVEGLAGLGGAAPQLDVFKWLAQMQQGQGAEGQQGQEQQGGVAAAQGGEEAMSAAAQLAAAVSAAAGGHPGGEVAVKAESQGGEGGEEEGRGGGAKRMRNE